MRMSEVIAKNLYREKIKTLLLDPQLGTRRIPGTENLGNVYCYSNCHGTAMYVLGVYNAKRPLCFSPFTLEKILREEEKCQAKDANLVIFNQWCAGFREPINHSAIPLYDGESDILEVRMFEQAGLAEEFGICKIGLQIEVAGRGDYVCEAVFYHLDVDRVKRDHHKLLTHNESTFDYH